MEPALIWLRCAWLARKLIPQAGLIILAECMRTRSLLAPLFCKGEVSLDQMRG